MVSGFQSIVDTVLTPVFGWLLRIPSIVAILFLSLLLGLVSTLLQKYLTDQAKMRRLKDDTKKLQKQMKDAQKKGEHDKMLKAQQKMMPIQMDLLRESFKPLLWTMVPFLLIFFWLSVHFAFLPVEPGVPFTVTAAFEDGVSGNATLSVPEGFTVDEPTKAISNGAAVWTVKGPEGEHDLTLHYAGADFTRSVLVTHEREYLPPVQQLHGSVQSITIGNAKLLPLGPGFNLFGWQPSWIFYYIILSIPISLGLKKLLRVV